MMKYLEVYVYFPHCTFPFTL